MQSYTVNWGDGLADAAKNKAESQIGSELDSRVFDDLRKRIIDQRDGIERTDPDYWVKIGRCDDALKSLETYKKEVAKAVGNIAFDAVKSSFNALLPITPKEKHPTNEAFKSTFGNANPSIEAPSVKFVYEFKSLDFDALMTDVLAGNQNTLKAWSLEPIKSIGLEANFHYTPEIKGTFAFGISDIKDAKDFAQNTFYINMHFDGRLWDRPIEGGLQTSYLPATRVYSIIPLLIYNW